MPENGNKEVLEAIQALSTHVDGQLKVEIGRVDSKIDRIATVVVETQSAVNELQTKVGHLEENQNNTYNKIDGFMSIINRYEAEIAAVRHAYTRTDARLTALESKRA